MAHPKIIFTDSERERLNGFPADISTEDLISHYTLTEPDKNQIQSKRGDHNRLGFSLQLGTLRYLGFCPDDLLGAPYEVIDYLANQLEYADSGTMLKIYGGREHTRTDHFQQIQNYLGFRKPDSLDFENLAVWLLARSLEHDKPTLLFNMACEWLYSGKIVRPGVTILEKIIISSRQQAQEETYNRLSFLLSDERKSFLDKLLTPDPLTGRTPHFWLRYGATANTPKAILETIAKLDYLREGEVDQWNLGSLNPNRQKFLAQLGRKSTNQALQRASEQQRYPILLAFLRQSLEDITDELIDLFIRCLANCYSRAKNDLKAFKLLISKSTNEKLIMFQNLCRVLVDSNIPNVELRNAIYAKIPEEVLLSMITECGELIRIQEDNSYEYLGNRFSYIRKFSPKFLETLDFRSNRESDPLLAALDTVKQMDMEGKRKIPEDAPLDFIPKSWAPYVRDEEGKVIRKYYEISSLWELRIALRSGDIWVKDSRRYTDPESYLIPKDQWPALRSDACRLLGLPEKGAERLKQKKEDLALILCQLDQELSKEDSGVRIEDNKIVLTPYKAEELPESSKKLKEFELCGYNMTPT